MKKPRRAREPSDEPGEGFDSRVRRRDTDRPERAADPTKVLVVDDDALARSEVVCAALDAGYEALAVADPQLALAICVKERPGVLLCSAELVGMPAMKLVRLVLLALGDEAPSHMIYTSGNPRHVASRDVEATFAKPVDPERLRMALDLAIEKRRRDAQ